MNVRKELENIGISAERNSEHLEKLGLGSIYICIWILNFIFFSVLFRNIIFEITTLLTGWGSRKRRLGTDLCKCRDRNRQNR